MTNLDLKDISKQLLKYSEQTKPYLPIIFFVSITLTGAFLVFSISQFASIEPTEDQVSEKLETIKRPNIDQASVNRIHQLQDQNVELNALFKSARDNPFSE